jgi:hypothetical protein
MEQLLWAIIGGLGSLVLILGAGIAALWRSSFSAALRNGITAFQQGHAELKASIADLVSKFERHSIEDREAHAKHAVLAEKVLNINARVDGLHEWKNERGEPMVGKIQMFMDGYERDRHRGRRDG